jgi:enamine deaminase RidA (YjgF/YER057c/UK114 family)
MIIDRIASMLRMVTLIRRTLRHKPTSPYTVGDLIEERATAHGQRPFLLFEERRISYSDVNAAANRVAHWAHAEGLHRGDRVALLMHNRPEYLFAWAGLAKLGAVVPLINPHLRGETLRHVLEAAEARWLIAGAECLETLAPEGQQATYDVAHFAPAVVEGDRIYVSGVIGTDAAGKVPDDPATQFECAFEGVKKVLEAAGAGLGDIVEITTYHVDFHDHLKAFVAVKDRYITEPYPAWTAIGISALARRKGLVEIRATASKKS